MLDHFFSHSLSVDLLRNSCFSFIWKCPDFRSFLDLFVGSSIVNLKFFFFPPLKKMCYFLLTSMASDEKPAVIWIDKVRNCFQDFFFVFNFQRFDYGHKFVLVWIFLGLPCLELAQVLESVGLNLLSLLASFQSLLLWVLFQSYLLSSLLLGLWQYVRASATAPWIPEALLAFLPYSTFCSGGWVVPTVLPSNSLFLPSVPFILLLIPTIVLNLLLHSSVLKFLSCSSFYLVVLLLSLFFMFQACS